MASELTTMQLLLSFLGGGVVSGLMGAFNAAMSVRDSRRVAYLEQQLQKVYGPLWYLTSENSTIWGYSVQLQAAYNAEYVGKQWSEQQSTQDSIRAEIEATLEIGNDYIHRIWDNNEKIVAVLSNNYELIDIEDAEWFQRFLLSNVRKKIEFPDGKLTLPIRVFMNLNNINIYNPEFAAMLATRFKTKSDELELLRLRWLPWVRRWLSTALKK